MKLLKIMTKEQAHKYKYEMTPTAYLMATSKWAFHHPSYGKYQPVAMVKK